MVTQELLNYIHLQLQHGINQETLRNVLLQNRWSEADIQQAFAYFPQLNAPATQFVPLTPVPAKENHLKELLTNIRFYVLLFTILLSVGIYIYYTAIIPGSTLHTVKMTQAYALIATLYLYLTLLATPLTEIFKFLPFRAQYIKARRAIGVSVLYFASLHSFFVFFGQLGGFGGLGFLSNQYLVAIGLGFTALVIFTAMATTSFDFMVDKLGFAKWKMFHRLIYLASFLVLIHALMIGTHFTHLSNLIPKIFFGALAFLLFLEAIRFDNFLQTKFTNLPKFSFTAVLITAAVTAFLFYLYGPSLKITSLGTH